jgi:ubiquinone/menaquinone biosynthesis C-methylase UbiE
MRNVIDEGPQTNEAHAAYIRSFVSQESLTDREVLDIGCGFGWFIQIALEGGAKSVVGLEPTDEDLATARRHLVDDRVTFRVGSVVHLPFADDSFDTVAMWEVLEHIPKGTEAAAFAEMARVLRPGGALYLSTPHSNIVAMVTDPAWWVAGHRHYSKADVAMLSRAADFEIDVIEVKAGMANIVFMLNMYVAKWIFRRPPFLRERSLRLVERDWAKPKGIAHVVLAAHTSGS